MEKLIKKLENFLYSDFVKIILDKEEVKTIIEYYNNKGEKNESNDS